MKASKPKIIKEKAGELAHMDTHYLPKGKGIIANDNKRYYLFGIIDSCTRMPGWSSLMTLKPSV